MYSFQHSDISLCVFSLFTFVQKWAPAPLVLKLYNIDGYQKNIKQLNMSASIDRYMYKGCSINWYIAASSPF